jgi:hypothetical protein
VEVPPVIERELRAITAHLDELIRRLDDVQSSVGDIQVSIDVLDVRSQKLNQIFGLEEEQEGEAEQSVVD